MSESLRGKVLLAVSKRERGGWSGNALKARVISSDRHLHSDELLVQVELKIPARAFSKPTFHIAGDITEAAALQQLLERELQGFSITVAPMS